MTLFKQIIISFILVGFCLFLAVGVLNLKNLNNYINDQLGANATHTANSLGLSIKALADTSDLLSDLSNDSSMLQTVINSMFDSGYYQMIRFDDVDGKTIAQSKQANNFEDIPSWFVKLVKLDAPIKSSEVMGGWSKIGTIYVQSSTGLAYYEFYASMKNVFLILLLMFVVTILVAGYGLKAILRPLVQTQRQAEAILENRFEMQKTIPFTTDLRHMVLAMNSMVTKVEDIFKNEAKTLKKYQELLYKDSSTGLYNRRYFHNKFDEYIKSEDYSSGSLVLLSFSDILSSKKQLGFERWQSLIIKLAQTLQQAARNKNDSSFVARLNDNDFILMLTGTNTLTLGEFLDELVQSLRAILDSFGVSQKGFDFNLGVVDYFDHTDLKTLLTRADVTLASAKEAGAFVYKIFDSGNSMVLGKEQYKQLILESIKGEMFKFAAQQVRSEDESLTHYEVYLRLINEEGKWQTASYFMPMASELNLSSELDFYVLDRVAKLCKNGIFDYSLAINLGKDTINTDSNFTKLAAAFKNLSQSTEHKIYIELANKDDIGVGNLFRFTTILKEYGLGFGLDHFDFSPSSIEKIGEISPDYVKIRAATILDFFADKDSDEISKSLDVILGSRGIKVVAIGVENEDQRDKMLQIGISSMQGILIQETKNIG